MRIPWPITVVAVLVTVAVFTIGVITAQMQTVPTAAAPGWWDFVAANGLRVLVPAAIVGVIARIVERNIRRTPAQLN